MSKGPSLLALLLVALAIGGCGGDGTFSVTGFDSIQQGDSAESVKSELGDPASSESVGEGSELWVYCDGPSPYYLAVTDGEVSIAGFRPPDELRISEQACG